jgi:hypothetical protein
MESPDHPIVYLLAEGAVPADSPIAPHELEAALGVETVHHWAEVVAWDSATSLEAIVIHDSALSTVDPTWLQAAYRRGLVIAIFNAYAPEIGELLGESCIANDGFASEAYPDQFFVVVSRVVIGSPPDVARIEKDFACGEKQVEGVEGQALVSFGRSADTISDTSGRNAFARVLVNHIDSIEQARRDMQSSAPARRIGRTYNHPFDLRRAG